MGQNIRRATVFFMTVALLLCSISAPRAEAAKKKTVLSSKKLTIAAGKYKTLKLKKNKKKVKWTVVSGKKCVSLKLKKKTGVRILARKKGTAKVQAKIGKKKYICKITVKEAKVKKKVADKSRANKNENSASKKPSVPFDNTSSVIWSDATHFIAHRGHHLTETENSMGAFLAAINNGYYGIETDLRVTKDGVFVLSHDDNLWARNLYQRPSDLTDETEIEGNISELTYEQIERLTSGQMVKLEELLELLQDKKEVPLIELKNMVSSAYPSLEDMGEDSVEVGTDAFREKQLEFQSKALLDVISKYNMLERCYITSFDKKLIEKVREQSDIVKIQFITNKTSYNLSYLKLHNFGLDWEFRKATKEAVKALRDNNINVCLWTIDDYTQTQEALSWSPNAITTNKHIFQNR